MKLATIINVHGNTELVQDTLDAVRTWVTEDVLLVVDGAKWDEWGAGLEVPAYKLRGFFHGVPKSPYRNVTLALMTAHQQWPKADWYCYSEYDVLFTSSAFKEDLASAADRGVWCIGNDLRTQNFKFPFLEKMLKTQFDESKYLLGCCVFHHGDFIRKLHSEGFFNKFLNWTNIFSQGHFPDYEEQGGYDVAEHLYPTLANHYGGKVEQFATWHHSHGMWQGNFRKYPMRWQPEIDPQQEDFPEASIVHPIKDLDHPIRQSNQVKRYQFRKGRHVEKPKLQFHNFGVRGGCLLRSSGSRQKGVDSGGAEDASR